MIKVSVMYPNTPGNRFNHEYYRDKHMPLVKARMGETCKYYTVDKGLAGGAPGAPATYVGMCHIFCDSVEAFQAGFGAGQGPRGSARPNHQPRGALQPRFRPGIRCHPRPQVRGQTGAGRLHPYRFRHRSCGPAGGTRPDLLHQGDPTPQDDRGTGSGLRPRRGTGLVAPAPRDHTAD